MSELPSKFISLKEKVSSFKVGDDTTRVFHGRGGAYPGLEHIVIDSYSNTLLLILFKEEEHVEELCSYLTSILNPKSFFVQKRYLRPVSNTLYCGEVFEDYYAQWKGLKFKVDFLRNQNPGYFIDMEKGRDFVFKNSMDSKVLNLFSFTCTLSVIALKGGAKEVINVDMGKGVLSKGRENHQINGIDKRKVSFLPHDILKSLGKISKIGPFNGVIIDPPSDQGKSFKLERDYPKILKRLEGMLSEGAWAMICINSPFWCEKSLLDMVNEYCPKLKLVNTYGAPEEFDEGDNGALKIMIFRNN